MTAALGIPVVPLGMLAWGGRGGGEGEGQGEGEGEGEAIRG